MNTRSQHRAATCTAAILLTASAVADAACGPGGYPHLPQGPFVDAGNGLVRHVPTHTIWKRCAEGQSWSGRRCTGEPLRLSARAAMERATAVNASAPGTQNAGQTSWRLPRLHELRLLVEAGCARPAINQTQFPRTPSLPFWTETAYIDMPDAAWTVDFAKGTPRGAARAERAAVRLVRVASAQDFVRPAAMRAKPAMTSVRPPDPMSTIVVTGSPIRPTSPPAAQIALTPPPGAYCVP